MCLIRHTVNQNDHLEYFESLASSNKPSLLLLPQLVQPSAMINRLLLYISYGK